MPEIDAERNLQPNRQCEIRRPSDAAVIVVGGQRLTKPAGYFFDVVWLPAEIARKGAKITDASGTEWLIAEVFGTRQMPKARVTFRAAP